MSVRIIFQLFFQELRLRDCVCVCVCVYVEPDATAPADAGADANAGATGSLAAELGSDQRHVGGDHGTRHAARRPGAGAPQQEEPHHRGQRAPDRLPALQFAPRLPKQRPRHHPVSKHYGIFVHISAKLPVLSSVSPLLRRGNTDGSR